MLYHLVCRQLLNAKQRGLKQGSKPTQEGLSFMMQQWNIDIGMRRTIALNPLLHQRDHPMKHLLLLDPGRKKVDVYERDVGRQVHQRPLNL